MAFQTPITIKQALDRIHTHEFLLPAIQREFVWKPEQIEKLFDSLMRGYPVGSFLFWKVSEESAADYNFYEFITHYNQRERTHNPRHENPAAVPRLTAVLDGQQRLTAMNIGLYGTYASKLPRLWWNNPDAFPKRSLHLDLLASADEDDEDLVYRFSFRRPKDGGRQDAAFWYKVGDVLGVHHPEDFWDITEKLELPRSAGKTLSRLHRIVHKEQVISAWEEEDQDPERVLNIFVRTNSGGTFLSHSDMLLSMAVAQWDDLDAREEIHGLVDTLNRIGEGFAFDHDFVLKACLLLGESESVRFKVSNFRNSKIGSLQERWRTIKETLRTTVRLASSLGYSRETLTAKNSLLPVAYFLQNRDNDPSRTEREEIRSWLIRSLLKRGVWGSGLDTSLVAIRAAIQSSKGLTCFPTNAIEVAMRRQGKDLSFSEEEIEDLADTPFGPRAYSVLALLYDFVNVEKHRFHVDHVFPRSRLTPTRLRKAGVKEEQLDSYKERVDRLPNLQLLEGSENSAKGAAMPLDWMRRRYTPEQVQTHCEQHDLGRVPDGIDGFLRFHDDRRDRMVQKLRARLAVSTSNA